MNPLALTHYTAVSSLGRGLEATLSALKNHQSGLRPCNFEDVNLSTYVGTVDGLESLILEDSVRSFDCRNNRLALLGLQQDGFLQAVLEARERFGPHRIGVIIGTNSSGMLETEHAYRQRHPDHGELSSSFCSTYAFTHNMFSVGNCLQRYLELRGPAQVISAACASGAKVFASAARLIDVGLCDAVIVGGVDSLCRTNLLGFASLDLLSQQPCRPCDEQRDGISIGEAAGFVLLERPTKERRSNSLKLLGVGESTDGYHMTHPHPRGEGAAMAMSQALAQARLDASDIDFIHLHGTGTKANDVTEDQAVTRVLGRDVPCGSTKGWTGHTLGAAGMMQVVIAGLCLQHAFLPGTLMTTKVDPALTSCILLNSRDEPVQNIMCNAFGFGGNNCSLIIGKV